MRHISNPCLQATIAMSILSSTLCGRTVVWNQPSGLPHHVCDGCWTSDYDANGNGHRSFDDFVFPTKTIVTGVHWQGAYWETRTGNEHHNPVDLDTESWDVSFFSNHTISNRDFPANRTGVISEQNVPIDDVEFSFIEDHEFDWPDADEVAIPVFDFSLQLNDPVTLEADHKYWFSPLSHSPTLQPLFTWTVSDLRGKSVQHVNNSGRFIRNNNFVFTLFGVNGDFDADDSLTVVDIDELAKAIRSSETDPRFDLDLNGELSQNDLLTWLHDFKGTWVGDTNLDGEFNSEDIVKVFEAGHYNDDIDGNSSWSEGDWNADGDFDSNDIVSAFIDGGYALESQVQGARSVPEPSFGILPLCMALMISTRVLSSNRSTVRRFRSSLPIICLVLVATASSTHAGILSNGDFDDLPIGNAPNNDQAIGGWQLYQTYDVEKLDDGSFRDVYFAYESSAEQISVVPTSTIDPSRSGNSLRIVAEEGFPTVFHMFDQTVEAMPGQTLQAEFELFVTNPQRERIGFMYLSADHGGNGLANRWDRGPQLSFRDGTSYATQCDSAHCSIVDRTPVAGADLKDGDWQKYRLDVDLASNTYDAFWSVNGDELQLVGENLKFRSAVIERLDRFNLAAYAIGDDEVGGELFLDNVSVRLLGSETPVVPEPSSTCLVIVGAMLCGHWFRRRRLMN